MHRLLLLSGLLVLMAAPGASGAGDPTAPGSYDRSFGVDGVVRTKLGEGKGAENPVLRAAVLRDGRTLVLTETQKLARFTARGKLDRDYGKAGIVDTRVPGDGNDSSRDMVVHRDGTAVVVGTQRADTLVVQRFDANGRLDPGFNMGKPLLIPTESITWRIAVAAAPDGALFVSFVATSPIYTPERRSHWYVVALTPQGAVDRSWGSRGVAELPTEPTNDAHYGTVRLVRMSDGSLRVVAHQWRSGRRRSWLVGLDPAGQPDAALGPEGRRLLSFGLTPSVLSPAPLDNLLLTGTTAPTRTAVARLTSAGALDPAFGAGGIRKLPEPMVSVQEATIVQGNRIAVAGATGSRRSRSKMAVARLLADGTTDRRFGRRGVIVLGKVNDRASAYAQTVGWSRPGRLRVVGTKGDGLSSIRNDFGPDSIVLASLRSRRAKVGVGRRWTVTRKGRARVPVTCRTWACYGTLRAGGVEKRFALRPGRSTLTLRLGSGRPRTLRVAVITRPYQRSPMLDDEWILRARLRRR